MSHYEALKLQNFASLEEVKKSYRRLAMLYHPDRTQGDVQKEETFKSINTAYQTIGDRDKKNMYDSQLRTILAPQKIRRNAEPAKQPEYTREQKKSVVESYFESIMQSLSAKVPLLDVYNRFPHSRYKIDFTEFSELLQEVHKAEQRRQKDVWTEYKKSLPYIRQRYIFLISFITTLSLTLGLNIQSLLHSTILLSATVWFSLSVAVVLWASSFFLRRRKNWHLLYTVGYLGLTSMVLYKYNIISIFAYLLSYWQ